MPVTPVRLEWCGSVNPPVSVPLEPTAGERIHHEVADMDHVLFSTSLTTSTHPDQDDQFFTPEGDSRHERSRQITERMRTSTGPERARLAEELILVNRCVADSIAHRYSGRGVAEEDVRQVAAVGLVKAVRRFDPGRERDLLAFAVPTIRGEIRRHFRDQGWMVRPPRRIQEMQTAIVSLQQRTAQSLGREPTEAEAVAALGTSPREYREALNAFGSFAPLSLDRPAGEDASPIGDRLPDVDDGFAAAEARLVLEPAVRQLTDAERALLEWRFLDELTQAEIGERLGVTQAQVSRLLSTLLKRMRTLIDGGVPAAA